MKYSDQQRIEKMRETTEKLLRYVEKENITPERIFAEEAVQWTVTTPLYNIGEHAAIRGLQEAISGYSMGEDCRTAAQAGASL